MSSTVFVGIDVSAVTLVVTTAIGDQKPGVAREYPNDSRGHKRLIKHISALGESAHICLEPTSTYHLDLVFRLAKEPCFTVSVVNPRAVKDYGRSLMRRAKTDVCDSRILTLYCQAHDLPVWQPPRVIDYELRSLSRQIHNLTKRRTALKNQQHSAKRAPVAKRVLQTLAKEIRFIEGLITQLQDEAMKLISSDEEQSEFYQLLISIVGVGQKSAIRILGELMVMARNLEKKQLIAGAGLDPMPRESGTSVKGKRRLSKQGNAHLRGALNIPALVAIQRCAEVQAYYEHLLEKGCAKLSAICAVMRKLLQAIWGMFRTKTAFQPEMFFKG